MNDIRATQDGRAITRWLACALGALALLAGAMPRTRARTNARAPAGRRSCASGGPRGNALGGTIAGDVSGIEAAFWNPAGLATIERTEALFRQHALLSRTCASTTWRSAPTWVRSGRWGCRSRRSRWGTSSSPPRRRRRAPARCSSPRSWCWVLVGAHVHDRVQFGATFDYVGERVQDMSASGLAFDFGVQYRTGWRNLQFGWS